MGYGSFSASLSGAYSPIRRPLCKRATVKEDGSTLNITIGPCLVSLVDMQPGRVDGLP